MLGACDSLIGFLCTVIGGVALGVGFTVGQNVCAFIGSLMRGKPAA